MIYSDRPLMTQVIFAITTKCNFSCPDCCSNIPNLPSHEDVSWEYIENAARFLKGKIFHIKITGGEPMMHAQFDDFAPRLKDVFGLGLLGLETNGVLAPLHEKALRCFDYIHCTVYEPSVFQYADPPVTNPPDNTEARHWLREHFASNILGEVRVAHAPRRRIGSGNVCAKGTADIGAYWFGKLYPCCAASGVPGAEGLVLDDDWQSKIKLINMPCETCWFSP